VLAPQAAQVDRAGIPASHIAAIKASGLLGMGAPVEVGAPRHPPR
jgi:alkylation response protein AidB-like acyl-CoA dehydrogenase